jgi:uncharacterized membrane protein
MENKSKKSTFDLFKMISAWILSFGLRLMPFRPPNIEPILAIQMPFTKKFGFIFGFMFAFFNIVIFDVVTGRTGLWTIITASVYGLLALFSAWYFKNRKNKARHYAIHAIYATLIYDALTGLTIGPLFFGQSFYTTLIGQIPFTAYHLLGNVSLALLFSPAIYKFMAANSKLNFSYLKQKLTHVKA